LANWPVAIGGSALGMIVLAMPPVERVIHNHRRGDLKNTTGV